MKKLLLLVVLLAGLLVPARAGAAKPPAPTCGALITSDIRLTQDMTCAVLPALQIAPGVTVDLGHHTVTVPNGGGTFPVSPAGAQVGVDYRYDMPHCGIHSPIDVDGSYWDAVGEPEDSVRFDGRTGTFRLTGQDEATFTSDDGEVLRLVRHDGPKSFPGCD